MSEPGSATGTGDESAVGADKLAGSPDAPPGVATKTDAEPEDLDSAGLVEIATKPFWVRHYTFTGTTVGLIFIWFSLTPSLLPRGPLFQALVSGFSGAIGYGLGVFSVWLVRYMRSKESSRHRRAGRGRC